jgi:hypothetical protein
VSAANLFASYSFDNDFLWRALVGEESAKYDNPKQ